jgi:hypothetical protein
VIARVRITWGPTGSALYINNQLVKSNSNNSRAPRWGSGSNLTIGSRNIRVVNGGYNASDDSIADFKIR